ncbi:uncharacterized protein LOC131650090 [Vicia villosa]|uniref:uncharacterized protein LOC131650090 n=1 Tax=Vicia villosa TaxID=3911 RepID=UPI00273A98B8|nr:uncharacterized protein LOC131650090 [Vicia villosa]
MRPSHNLEIVDEDELVHDYDEEVQFNDAFAPNSDEEEIEVEINEDEVQLGGELQVVADDDTDYVGSEDELDSFSDTEYEHNDNIVDCDWTTVLPSEKLFDKVNNSIVDDDSDVLLTPPVSEDDEEHEKFPTYKSGEVFKFQPGMIFNNKDMVRCALKEYAMKMNKKVALKKNDGKRMGVKLSRDKEYRAKRRAMELIQGAGMDQFTHLRRYAQELLKSNLNSNVVLQCADSNEGPVFERIYVCLKACKMDLQNIAGHS